MRLVAEEPCEHGEIGYCGVGGSIVGRRGCPGGTRQEVIVDYEAAAHVLREKLSTNGFKMKPAKVRAGHWVPDIIHAAISTGLGDTT